MITILADQTTKTANEVGKAIAKQTQQANSTDQTFTTCLLIGGIVLAVLLLAALIHDERVENYMNNVVRFKDPQMYHEWRADRRARWISNSIDNASRNVSNSIDNNTYFGGHDDTYHHYF